MLLTLLRTAARAIGPNVYCPICGWWTDCGHPRG